MIDFEIEPEAQQWQVESLVGQGTKCFLHQAEKHTFFFRRLDLLEPYLLFQLRDFFRKVSSLTSENNFHFLEFGILCSVDEVVSALRNKMLEKILEEFFVLEARVPPLREKTDEFPDLVVVMTQNYDQNCRENILRIASESKDLLTQYSWPGNLNELQSMLEGLSLLTENGRLNSESFLLEKLTKGGNIPTSQNNQHFLKNPKGVSKEWLSGSVCCTYST